VHCLEIPVEEYTLSLNAVYHEGGKTPRYLQQALYVFGAT